MQQANLLKSDREALSCIRFKALQDYELIYHQMRAYTLERDANTPDTIWLLEHHPVFTQGQSGKAEHILNPCPTIPIIQSDRGGQVTYHGPGQIMIYCLLDLNRRKASVRDFTKNLETVIIALLKSYGIESYADPKAPGIYINKAKIASIGLRVRKGCTYHGIALNVTNDLNPFLSINPCGYKDLKMTKMNDFIANLSLDAVYQKLTTLLPAFLI